MIGARERGAVPAPRAPEAERREDGEPDGQPEEGEGDGSDRVDGGPHGDVGGAVHRIRGEEHHLGGGHAGERSGVRGRRAVARR